MFIHVHKLGKRAWKKVKMSERKSIYGGPQVQTQTIDLRTQTINLRTQTINLRTQTINLRTQISGCSISSNTNFWMFAERKFPDV